MTTDSQYSWPRFFMELADQLLAFRDDRQGLIATLKQVYAEIGMTLPTLDSGGVPMDIDPFTVYGLFNRGLTDAKRRVIALGLGGALGVQAPLRDDFVGVPVLLNINATFYDQVRRDDGDIERLWDLFAVALAYTDEPSEQTEMEFCRAYDVFFNSVASAGISRWDSSGSAPMPTSTCARVIAGSSGCPTG